MKIKSVRIQNLRSFKDETVNFNEYTCIVGPNGVGKSNILCALNIFFRDTQNSSTNLQELSQEDFHLRNTDDPIIITVTFRDLSIEAQEDFKEYFRQGELVIQAVAHFDLTTGKAEVKQYGERKAMKSFAAFFKADGDKAKVPELVQIYHDIRLQVPGLPDEKTKQKMIDALHEYESSHPDECELIPSEDLFYGFSKGVNRLSKHIQWIHVPAVKDATTEQTEGKNALARLLERTVRAKTNFGEKVKELREETRQQYQKLLDENQTVLNAISSSLGRKLADWSHPDAKLQLQWRQDESSVKVQEPFAQILAGEGGFEGELCRFGHGLQRSYLLALLQELSELATQGDGSQEPLLILGCEEPELYQHPPQARHLSNVLQKLSEGNAQVIVCTHSPYFVSGKGFEDIRLVKKEAAISKVSQARIEQIGSEISAAFGEGVSPSPTGTMLRVHQALQPAMSEIFFTSCLVLVEGIEDYAYLTTYLNLSGQWDEFRRCGCHIVPVNGKDEMLRPIAIAKTLGIPTWVVFDSDSNETRNKDHHQKINAAILKLCGEDTFDPLPPQTYWGKRVAMWSTQIKKTVKDEITETAWEQASEATRTSLNSPGEVGKNILFIGEVLVSAWESGNKSVSLERLCTEIVNFCKRVKLSVPDYQPLSAAT